MAGVPYAYFSNGGVYEWAFLETARSFREKLNLARTYRLHGFSVWVLGPEDPAMGHTQVGAEALNAAKHTSIMRTQSVNL